MSKVKICGLSRMEDITAVNRALPDYIGFVFAQSHRRLDLNKAAALKKNLAPSIKAVGVFVNERISVVSQIYRRGIINMVQLHGDEDDEYIGQLKNVCGCPIIKAIGVGAVLPTLSVVPDYLLFDTLSTQRGGIGKSFDWNVLKEYHGLPYFLAGGLSIDNVADAIGLLSPFCVDVSSGVETDGFKDAIKISKFVNTARRKTNE